MFRIIFNFSSLTLFLLLASCANTPLASPEIQGVSLGIPSEGTVQRISLVSDSQSFSIDRFAEAGSNYAILKTAKQVSEVDPLFSFITAVAGSIGQAVAGKVEEDITRAKCLYFVSIAEDKIPADIRSTVFPNFGFSSNEDTSVFGIENDEFLDGQIPTADISSDAVPSAPTRDFPSGFDSKDPVKEKYKSQITIPQTCLVNIKKGTKVLISFHNWGATLHPLLEEDYTVELE